MSIILSALLFVPAWSQAEKSSVPEQNKKILQAAPKHHDASIFVSIIQLIANPGKYNHKYVEVEGYMVYRPNPYTHKDLEPKGVLYLTKENADYKMESNAVFLVFPKYSEMVPENNHFDKKHVVVEGVFRHYLEFEYDHFPNALSVSTIRSLEKEPTSKSEDTP